MDGESMLEHTGNAIFGKYASASVCFKINVFFFLFSCEGLTKSLAILYDWSW